MEILVITINYGIRRYIFREAVIAHKKQTQAQINNQKFTKILLKTRRTNTYIKVKLNKSDKLRALSDV